MDGLYPLNAGKTEKHESLLNSFRACFEKVMRFPEDPRRYFLALGVSIALWLWAGYPIWGNTMSDFWH